jgi:DNA-binding LytR/AlgR family response regulator
VVFLDIEMPALNGMQLAERLRQGEYGSPLVVFVTAHDRHAVRAFDVRAADYLLKPVEPRRLKETIDRLRRLRQPVEAAAAPAAPPEAAPRFLAGHEGERAFPVALEQISYLAAQGDTVHLVTTGGRQLQLRGATLTEMERLLPSDRFFRCHRGYLVQVHEVAEIVPFFNGTFILRMKGSRDEVPVSRSNVRRLKELFRLP